MAAEIKTKEEIEALAKQFEALAGKSEEEIAAAMNLSVEEIHEAMTEEAPEAELSAGDLDQVAGGASKVKYYTCGCCGKKVKNTAISKAWHWFSNGCWGY